MPAIPLPEHASIEHLKKQAKLLRRLVSDADAGALDLIREFHPRFPDVSRDAPPSAFKLADAQLVVARLYGQPSWARLGAHVELVEGLTRPDPADLDEGSDVDRFVTLACVSYNGDVDLLRRVASAAAMGRADPGLAAASIASAAVAGNHVALTGHLEADPAALDRPCGPNGWPPLLYCCYSRLQDHDDRSTLRTGQLLLERGADPDAGFLWRGLVPPFTALTGALGGGEAGQPPHPAAMELARALLEAGADANDGQALYNLGLGGVAADDPSHLRLLVDFGLGTRSDGPWYRRLGGRLTDPAELLHDELEVAALRSLPRRMQFLIDLGLDLDRPVGRSRRTPLELADHAGHAEIRALLVAAGAETRKST